MADINNFVQNNFRGGNNQIYNFSSYVRIGYLFNRIYNEEFPLPEAEREQRGLDFDYDRLQRYRRRYGSLYYQIREDVFNNIRHHRDERQLVTDGFRDPLRDPAFYPQRMYSDSSESDETDESDNNGNNGGNMEIMEEIMEIMVEMLKIMVEI